ncbi:hypothetical protein ECTPHS_04868 [Ectothiorhodospira sp. PHS-1]|nr:hypothetical protein ECTPHS_04868 [Ectothiorhodospira sp. PHS-1]
MNRIDWQLSHGSNGGIIYFTLFKQSQSNLNTPPKPTFQIGIQILSLVEI